MHSFRAEILKVGEAMIGQSLGGRLCVHNLCGVCTARYFGLKASTQNHCIVNIPWQRFGVLLYCISSGTASYPDHEHKISVPRDQGGVFTGPCSV